MLAEDVIIGNKYHHGSINGPVVEVYSKHQYIANHFYIRFIDKNSVDTTRSELLFPLEETC